MKEYIRAPTPFGHSQGVPEEQSWINLQLPSEQWNKHISHNMDASNSGHQGLQGPGPIGPNVETSQSHLSAPQTPSAYSMADPMSLMPKGVGA